MQTWCFCVHCGQNYLEGTHDFRKCEDREFSNSDRAGAELDSLIGIDFEFTPAQADSFLRAHCVTVRKALNIMSKQLKAHDVKIDLPHPRQAEILRNNWSVFVARAMKANDLEYREDCIKQAGQAAREYFTITGEDIST